jgi:small multidrug resistance family-3 protein
MVWLVSPHLHVSSIVWGALVDKKKPDRYEIVESLIVLLGAAAIYYSPR